MTPGLYAAAILLSAAGTAALDWRFRLAAFRTPWRMLAVVGIGTAFFLIWDLAGIAAGIFIKGESDAYLGLLLAPHLPVEEILFLAFLCYLTLVVWAGVEPLLPRERKDP